MEIQNIIEICVAIDIAILGIAYPIIVDKISNIGDKYFSQYLSELFDNEFPQKSIRLNILWRQHKFSIFKSVLYLTVFTFIFLIFNFKPLFGWNNWFINNSAKLAVLVATAILTIFFFIWLDKVVLYNGKSTSLLKRIIQKYGTSKASTELKSYFLKAINEITFYAITKQDEHLQQTLLEFYSREFLKIRRNHDKVQPLVYPIDLYFLVNNLNVELVGSQNNKLPAIEHRAVSGAWLLGQDSEHVIISEETYNWLWRNLYIICDKDKFIRMYWGNASQYFAYHLKHIRQDFDFERGEIKNESEIKKREEERKEFLELHYALGGLLLYRENHKAIRYIFEHTQSQPPNYPLLSHSMTEIFTWFEYFRNEFKPKGMPIDTKYYFPELDNLGSKRQIIYWICSYLCLLFIRQYTLDTYYVYQNHTSQPQLPNDVIELNNWLETVLYFKRCLDTVLKNDRLISDLKLTETVNDHQLDFDAFLEGLRESIVKKIGQQKLTAQLSERKVEKFKITSRDIIKSTFSHYNNVLNSSFETIKDTDLNVAITGASTLMTKSAFTDNDIPHLNYDSVFAEQIAENIIKRYIPYSFQASTTRRYLLNEGNLLTGLDKLIEKVDSIIVGINLSYHLNELLTGSHYHHILRLIPSTEHDLQDVLFVFGRNDLPAIGHKDLTPEEIEKLQLTLIDENLKLYASIIDINAPENAKLRKEWAEINGIGSEDLEVQVSIKFLSIISWPKDRDVVQVNLATEFKEQGIQNSINEIFALKDRKYEKLADT